MDTGAVARAGRLAVSVEQAADLLHATSVGVVLSLLSKAPEDRDELGELARSAVLAAVVTKAGAANTGNMELSALASGLRAGIADLTMLSPGERSLMDELLKRVADDR